MAYIRARLKQYHLGILILIISSQLVTLISSNTSTTSPPEATKCAEILSKKLTEAVTTTRQRKQNFSTLEISPTSSSATVMSPSVAVENRRNTNETYLRKHGCSREQKDDCPRYVDKYSSFYLKIGGWLMLGIVFAGITALGVTHFLGMKNMRRPRRRQLSRILWVEALTKSKLARFVWLNWHLAKGKNWKNFKAFRRGRDHKNVLMAIWSEEKTHHGSQQAKRSSVYIDFTFEHDSEIGITCLVYP